MVRSSLVQAHGGPDEQSVVVKQEWALGVNRLAIEDEVGGGQPYVLGGVIYAVLNGEIYNHSTLRRELENSGYALSTRCDGEVIPALYAKHGPEFARLLEGMFVIAIIDCRGKPRLTLVNDHLGIKPIYLHETSNGLGFSSEISGLWPLSGQEEPVDPAAIDLYLAMQSVLGPQTAFANVRLLEPGTILQRGIEGPSTRTVYTPGSSDEGPIPQNLDEGGEVFQRLLRRETRRMVATDARRCLVVSGGIDSGLVAALASESECGIKAFNIAYRGNWPADEREFAAEVGRFAGLDLVVVEADPDLFPKRIPEMVAHLGQPNAAPHALSTYLLYEEIGRQGYKVAIAGEGADEQFGGYARFAEAAADRDKQWPNRYLDKMSALPLRMRNELYSAEYAAWLEEGRSRASKVREAIADIEATGRLERLLRFDLYERFPYYILNRVDHLSMAHAVEVRVPFCQPAITRFARGLADEFKATNGAVKRVVYAAASGLVPRSVFERPKQPFTLPIADMLRAGSTLFEFVRDRLVGGQLRGSGYFRMDVIDRWLKTQVSEPQPAMAKALWTLMILDVWLETVGRQNRSSQ